MRFPVLVMLAASCGSEGPVNETKDAAVADARPGGDADLADAGIDAPAPDAHQETVTNLTCTDYTRTVTHANGTKSETTGRYAVVVDVHPGDAFRVEACYSAAGDPYVPPACSTGETCVGTVAPQGLHCFSYRDGSFVDGKLMAYCGAIYRELAANGSVISVVDTSYATVKLYR